MLKLLTIPLALIICMAIIVVGVCAIIVLMFALALILTFKLLFGVAEGFIEFVTNT